MHAVSSLRMGLSCRRGCGRGCGRVRGMIEYVCTIYTIYSLAVAAAAAANCWIRSSNNALTSV